MVRFDNKIWFFNLLFNGILDFQRSMERDIFSKFNFFAQNQSRYCCTVKEIYKNWPFCILSAGSILPLESPIFDHALPWTFFQKFINSGWKVSLVYFLFNFLIQRLQAWQQKLELWKKDETDTHGFSQDTSNHAQENFLSLGFFHQKWKIEGS